MADPTPTLEQTLNAVTTQLYASAPSAVILHYEDRRKSELETLREFQDQAGPDFEVEIVFMDADVESVEGKTYGEKYSIYNITLRHLYTRQDEEEISRIAKHRAEKIRGTIEANASIFRINSQVPLRTPETAELQGRFVDRDDSKYYESIIKFSVEARRWA